MRQISGGVLASLLALPLLAGCLLSPGTDPTVFLVLAPPADVSAAGRVPLPDLRIGVGPVDLPSYLDRPQMVMRLGPTELAVDEYARWAAPLRALVTDALVEHMVAELAPERVVAFPWSVVDRPTVSVRISVSEFERVAPDSAALGARWEVLDGEGRQLAEGRYEAREGGGGDPRAAARALSDLMGGLASRIASSVREVATATRTGG